MPYRSAMDVVNEKVKSMARGRESPAPGADSARRCPKHGTHSGTAVVAFHFKDGIVLAADAQSFEWNKIYTHDEKKVVQISSHSALGVCGSVAMEQFITQKFLELLSYFEMRTEQEIPAANQLRLFHRFMQKLWSSYWFADLEAGFIFAGVSPSGEPVLAEVSSDSALASRPIAAIGCGGDDAKAAIEHYFETGSVTKLTRAEALTLGVRAIFRAAYKDAFVGHPLVDLPMVAFITKDGYEEVAKEEMKKTVLEVGREVEKAKRGGMR